MRTFATISAAAMLVMAGPALAGGQAWQVGNDSFHVYLTGIDMTTVKGRAEGLAVVERAAAKLCDGVQPQVDFEACKTDTVKSVAAGSQGAMLALALSERNKVQTAAR